MRIARVRTLQSTDSSRPTQEFSASITVSSEGCTINWYSSADLDMTDKIRQKLADEPEIMEAIEWPGEPVASGADLGE